MNDYEGTVKWFSDPRGYGFIESDKLPKKDILAHYSQVQMVGYKTLKRGWRVQFNLLKTGKGLQASNISVLERNTA